MAWFFHVVELDDGGWACRRGNHEYDTHPDAAAALMHITAIASDHRPAEILVHRIGCGEAERVAELPAEF